MPLYAIAFMLCSAQETIIVSHTHVHVAMSLCSRGVHMYTCTLYSAITSLVIFVHTCNYTHVHVHAVHACVVKRNINNKNSLYTVHIHVHVH